MNEEFTAEDAEVAEENKITCHPEWRTRLAAGP
jgi:hypothetical protein